MIELVSRDLHHDLEAYRDFCSSRESYDKQARARPTRDREQLAAASAATTLQAAHAQAPHGAIWMGGERQLA